MFESWGLIERILYEPGREEDDGKYFVPLSYALRIFPRSPDD